MRGEKYAHTLRLINRQVKDRGLLAAVRGCYWGDAAGASLQADGQSIPGYGVTGGATAGAADQLLALWSVLYTDPLYELRLLAFRHAASSPVAAGAEPPSVLFRRAIREFEPSRALLDMLEDLGWHEHFVYALTAIQKAPELERAASSARADPLDHRRAVARAIIAQASVAATDAGLPQVDGAIRDGLTARLTDELHGYGMGAGDVFLSPVKGLAKYVITRKLTSDRGAITDSAAPFAGDVLRFLARGDDARAYLRQSIEDAGEAVCLLGHSLGGIMCVDLLARVNLPQVKGLITIGSQAPFLYEIGALPALTSPQPLPKNFPSWLNIFDRRDPLSYIAAGIFGSYARDIEVDNGQPFPESHSAYWTNDEVWLAIASFLS